MWRPACLRHTRRPTLFHSCHACAEWRRKVIEQLDLGRARRHSALAVRQLVAGVEARRAESGCLARTIICHRLVYHAKWLMFRTRRIAC